MFLPSISATDWLEETMPNEPSWRSEDTIKIAPILHTHGVDFLDVSTGGNHHAQKIKGGPAYQAPFAHAVKKSLDSSSKLVVGAVGLIRDGETAQGVLAKGQADVVSVGRQFLKNPSTVWAFSEELGIEVHLAHQIGWAFKGRHKRCSDGKEDHSGRVGHKCEV
jgi:2,4-dienoyl-CoA reductase-like NADH-dependent reductase (Old Yellow Enzyme family)